MGVFIIILNSGCLDIFASVGSDAVIQETTNVTLWSASFQIVVSAVAIVTHTDPVYTVSIGAVTVKAIVRFVQVHHKVLVTLAKVWRNTVSIDTGRLTGGSADGIDH